ncbi:class I SAM-dependent methyltransferase [Corynebacterium macginleyi]|uniref:class I SAM-dependent methyltransferase n=1 Tax=Corynebacterium macginleyi TaxID=38290 RepID=UPI000EF9B37B|nr:class I SAM-dependent methyltransferase [Corynebacterium macginleyi]RMB66395.1 class I SAM-dependent methyltransferase [Corynebacterium macginleyi]
MNEALLYRYNHSRPHFSRPWAALWHDLGFSLPLPKYPLDIGCGTGRSSLWLSEESEGVVAVDPVAASIDVARQYLNGTNIEFHHVSAEDLSAIKGVSANIDAVVFSGSFDWVNTYQTHNSLIRLGLDRLPVVCFWSWFNTSDSNTRAWNRIFRRHLGALYGADANEVILKAYLSLDSARGSKYFTSISYSADMLFDFVLPFSYWRPSRSPWGGALLKQDIDIFINEWGSGGIVQINFVEIVVDGFLDEKPS